MHRCANTGKRLTSGSAEHLQFPFTAAALGDTKYLKSSASSASEQCFLCIEQRHPARLQVPAIPSHLHLIRVLRLYIILLVLQP